MTQNPKVFLSHSSADKARIRPIAEQLHKNGIDAWIDEAEIKWGDSIAKRINEGLRTADLCPSIPLQEQYQVAMGRGGDQCGV